MLDKVCSVCGSPKGATIETVTNVAPKRNEFFPVILCTTHKASLARGELDIRMNEKGELYFINRAKPKS
jgi:hypothetical protein